MLKRTLVAIVLLISFLGAIILGYFFNKEIIEVYMMIWMLIAAYEMTHTFTRSGYKVKKFPITLFAFLTYPLMRISQEFAGMGTEMLIIMFVLTVFISMVEYTFSRDENLTISDFISTIFILVYPLFMVHLIYILTFNYYAIFVVATCVTIPIFSDAFAYYFGMAFGKKKLCERVSPKKTIAGGIGALVGAALISVLIFVLFDLYHSALPKNEFEPFISHSVKGWEWKNALIFISIGLVTGVVSQLGDLVASKIKRLMGIKDYGHIFPGHGGIMDRLDSIISSCLVLLIFLTLIARIKG